MKIRMWIARDKNTIVKYNDNYVTVWEEKPCLTRGCDDSIEYFDDVNSYFIRLKVRTFKKNFGFIPKKGTCQEVEMDVTLIRKEK